jgi:hypothetical protein
LKQESTIKANILWTWCESKVLIISRNDLIAFITPYCVFLFNKWSSTLKRWNVSFPSTRGFASNSIITIKLITIAKASL